MRPVFPRLSNLAKKYLCISATIAPSERVFCTGVTCHKACLKPKSVDRLVFLSRNLQVQSKLTLFCMIAIQYVLFCTFSGIHEAYFHSNLKNLMYNDDSLASGVVHLFVLHIQAQWHYLFIYFNEENTYLNYVLVFFCLFREKQEIEIQYYRESSKLLKIIVGITFRPYHIAHTIFVCLILIGYTILFPSLTYILLIWMASSTPLTNQSEKCKYTHCSVSM